MEVKLIHRFLAALVIAVGLASCGTRQGTEVVSPPNPLEGVIHKQALIVPEGGDEVYLATFFNLGIVLIDQRLRSDPDMVLDTKGASYVVEDEELRFNAVFDNGREIAVVATLNGSAISGISLTLDGQAVASTFTVLGAGDAPTQSECASKCVSTASCDTFLQVTAGVDDDEVAGASQCLASGRCQFDCSLDEESSAECLNQAANAGAVCTGNICTICPQ